MTLAHNSALERSWRTIDWRPALTLAVPAAAWLLVVGAGLALRPPLPVDETRYLSVAWEMWTRGDQLVPTLNGAPYSHKPPLLFWIIQLGWALFGVSEMWARLVPSLAGLLLLLLAYPFAANLWPDDRRARSTAPLLLAGTAAQAKREQDPPAPMPASRAPPQAQRADGDHQAEQHVERQIAHVE